MKPLFTQIDHLVYAAPDLHSGIAEIEQSLKVRATYGGQHPGRGTHNALLRLGPASYLEIIAPDPEQPSPKTPRAFGLDGLTKSRLVTWAAKAQRLDQFRHEAERNGVRLGEVISGSRRRDDGVLLFWQFTNPDAWLGDGLVPFFIDWGDSPHPAETAGAGLSLLELLAEHPDADGIQRILNPLGVALTVTSSRKAALIAVIQGPEGPVELR